MRAVELLVFFGLTGATTGALQQEVDQATPASEQFDEFDAFLDNDWQDLQTRGAWSEAQMDSVFTMAYLAQERARETDSQKLQGQAAEMYEELLRRDPADTSVLFNLAVLYEYQQEWEKAATALEEFADASSDTTEVYEGLLQAATCWRAAGKNDAAMEAYFRAAVNPSVADVRLAKGVSRSGSLDDLGALADRFLKAEEYGLAADAYLETMYAAIKYKEKSVADEAFAKWVGCEGWRSRVDSELLVATLPAVEVWNPESRTQLEAFFADPLASGQADEVRKWFAEGKVGWWQQTKPRKHALAQCIRDRQLDLRREQKFKESVALAQVGVDFGPCDTDYAQVPTLKGFRYLCCELVADMVETGQLGGLPELKFRDLTAEHALDVLPGGESRPAFLASAVRFHTALGMRLLESTAEASPERLEFGAAELDKAVAFGSRRSDRPTDIRELLISHLISAGRQQEAKKHRVALAWDYLFMDHLDKAKKIIINLPTGDVQTEMLSNVCLLRDTVSAFEERDLKRVEKDTLTFGWLFKTAFFDKSTPEIGVQRFRSLADIGDRADALGLGTKSLVYRAMAMQSLVHSSPVVAEIDLARARALIDRLENPANGKRRWSCRNDMMYNKFQNHGGGEYRGLHGLANYNALYFDQDVLSFCKTVVTLKDTDYLERFNFACNDGTIEVSAKGPLTTDSQEAAIEFLRTTLAPVGRVILKGAGGLKRDH